MSLSSLGEHPPAPSWSSSPSCGLLPNCLQLNLAWALRPAFGAPGNGATSCCVVVPAWCRPRTSSRCLATRYILAGRKPEFILKLHKASSWSGPVIAVESWERYRSALTVFSCPERTHRPLACFSFIRQRSLPRSTGGAGEDDTFGHSQVASGYAPTHGRHRDIHLLPLGGTRVFVHRPPSAT